MLYNIIIIKINFNKNLRNVLNYNVIMKSICKICNLVIKKKYLDKFLFFYFLVSIKRKKK